MNLELRTKWKTLIQQIEHMTLITEGNSVTTKNGELQILMSSQRIFTGLTVMMSFIGGFWIVLRSILLCNFQEPTKCRCSR